MTRMSVPSSIGCALVLVLAACSGDDSGTMKPTAACTATWTGNVTDTADATAACATIAVGSGSDPNDAVLAIDVPSTVLASPLAVSIDLGDGATTGTYSSETVETWSALGLRMAGSGGCAYVAGNQAVPTGSFTLALTALSPAAHGMLSLVEYVQAMPGTSCGAGDNEMIGVTF